MSVQGVVAIVTGAASGIGRATAELLAGKGASVILADVDESGAGGAAEKIVEAGATALACRVDVCNPDEVRAMVELAKTRFGRIDILVNNAGTCPVHAGVMDLTIEQWDHILNVNLRGTFLCSKAVLPAMLPRGGTIVNVASSAALYWPALYPAYTAAKMGVLGLTQCMARELGARGISVKAIRPVYVDTPMGREAFARQTGRQAGPEDAGIILQPAEVARIIVAMADPDTACASTTIVDTMVVRMQPVGPVPCISPSPPAR
jgi:NAD(P)-dependent dehydrogenase (short-subunit alcohol dehydrogenase family)